MYQKLNDDGTPKKPYQCHPNNIMIAIVLIMMFASGAFYYTFNEWNKDGFDRKRIHTQQSRYNTLVRSPTLVSKRNVDIHNGQQAMVDMLKEQVLGFEFNDSSPVAAPVIALWHQYNDTIAAVNASCTAKIQELTTIVAQLVNGTNTSESTNLLTGTCDFTGNTTIEPTTYTYDQIIIGGIDFFYYVFQATNGTVMAGVEGARIENCVPPIFEGSTGSGTIFKSQLSGLVGSPADPMDYVATVTVGEGSLQFIPVAGADPSQELGIATQISVFVSFF